MKQKIIWPFARLILEVVIIIEILSALVYFYPAISPFVFIVIMAGIVWLAVTKLEWAVYVLLLELLIGSKGYLLSMMIGDFRLSFRIAIWLIILMVWFIQLVWSIYRRQAWPIDLWHRLRSSGWLMLLLMLGWGVINALVRGNQLGNVFFDANGWLFWLILLPILSIKNWSVSRLYSIIAAGLTWLIIKTGLLLYAFTHISPIWQTLVYRWVRDSQIGEITRMSSQFYRIFIQSQVYLLIFIIIAAWQLARLIPRHDWLAWLLSKKGCFWLIAIGLALMPIIVGFSRSFWFGLVIMMLFLFIAIWRRYRWPIVWRWSLAMVLSGVVSLLSILIIVNFPWPKPQLSFNAGNILEERLGNLDSEAGASSRWSLLPKMIQSISQAPLLGQGFGATITYRSADPRILENESSGYYTTYAFEWGWLDIILKFGLIWALWYFIWLGRAAQQAWRLGPIGENWTIGLLSITAVHFFSPYLNHPLGIIWLVGLLVWLVQQQYESLSNR